MTTTDVNPLAPDDEGNVTIPPGTIGLEGTPEAFAAAERELGDLDTPARMLRRDGRSEIRLYRTLDGDPVLRTGDRWGELDLFYIGPGETISMVGARDPADPPPFEYRRLIETPRALIARELPELREAILAFYRTSPQVMGEQWHGIDTDADPRLAALAGVPYSDWARATSAAFGQAIKGPAYWVSWEMAEIADGARQALQGCGFRAHDLPAPAGWAYLDGTRTLTLTRDLDDPDGTSWLDLPEVRILLTWAEQESGNTLFPLGGVHFAVHLDRPAYVDLMAVRLRYEGPDELRAALDVLPPFVLIGHGYAKFTETDEIVMIGPSAAQTGPWLDLFRGMCALLHQPLVTTTDEYAPRPVQRRLHRAGSPHAAQPVRVIALRGPAGHGTGRSHAGYRHRWVVRGHWRRQACGPGLRERRPMWVMPHTKGPEGAPLLGGEKVYAWRH